MNLPILSSFIPAILFGVIAIYLSIKEEKTRKTLLEREQKQKQRLYEIAILKEIQERIGYSLDVERVVDVITGSLRNLFEYSSASSLLIREDKLVFKVYIEEAVNHSFVDTVRKSMIASLSALIDQALPSQTEESITGVVLNEQNTDPMSSFFHVPLIVNDVVVGLISISSTKPNLYKEDEMTIVYQITNQASNALSKLQSVLTTEKGKLLSMIGGLADGVFMVDTNDQVLVINDSAKQYLKITQDNPTMIDITQACTNWYDIPGKLQEAIIQGKSIQEEEVKLDDKILEIFITPVLDTHTKHVIGASVLLHDITLEKSLEQMKDDFTNMVVHELRAPLTAMKGAASLMSKDDTPIEKEDQKKLLKIINEQSNRLLDEVSSILVAAKLESGRFTIMPSPGNLEQTIRERVDFFLPQALAKRIKLELHFENNLPQLQFDALRVSQVINNLVSNSLKFTPPDGSITINAKSDSQHVTISVSDTGPGIPKDKQSLLFSKFYQASNSSGAKGTGIGLFIAKGIVEAHGGSIHVESQEGKGTTFLFTLPITHVTQQSPIPSDTGKSQVSENKPQTVSFKPPLPRPILSQPLQA